MNYIDIALANIKNGDEFVQALAEKYNQPEVDLSGYPEWIRNVLILIDYDTELH